MSSAGKMTNALIWNFLVKLNKTQTKCSHAYWGLRVRLHISCTCVRMAKKFRGERENMEDDECPGRSSTWRTNGSVEKKNFFFEETTDSVSEWQWKSWALTKTPRGKFCVRISTWKKIVSRVLIPEQNSTPRWNFTALSVKAIFRPTNVSTHWNILHTRQIWHLVTFFFC